MKHIKRLDLVYMQNHMCMITSTAEVHCLPLCKSGLIYRKQKRIKLKSYTIVGVSVMHGSVQETIHCLYYLAEVWSCAICLAFKSWRLMYVFQLSSSSEYPCLNLGSVDHADFDVLNVATLQGHCPGSGSGQSVQTLPPLPPHPQIRPLQPNSYAEQLRLCAQQQPYQSEQQAS